MDYPKLEDALLKDVTDEFYFGASCQKCQHRSRLRLSRLREHLGGDFPVVKIRPRLKCSLCSSRKVIVTFLAPNAKVSNLIELFAETPR